MQPFIRVWMCVCAYTHKHGTQCISDLKGQGRKNTLQWRASSVLSVTICWFPNQTLWFNEFPAQDAEWEACLLLWLHTASCDALSYIWHTLLYTKFSWEMAQPGDGERQPLSQHWVLMQPPWQEHWLNRSWRSEAHCVPYDPVRKVKYYLRASQQPPSLSSLLWDTLTSSVYLTCNPGTLTWRHTMMPSLFFQRTSDWRHVDFIFKPSDSK